MAVEKTYNPNMPSDVRAFTQEIARLTASGPVGAEQAARMLAQAQSTDEGRQLLVKARQRAKISAEMFGFNFNKVKIYSDGSPSQLQRDLQIQALSVEPIATSCTGDVSLSSEARDRVAHELTHVATLIALKGLK